VIKLNHGIAGDLFAIFSLLILKLLDSQFELNCIKFYNYLFLLHNLNLIFQENEEYNLKKKEILFKCKFKFLIFHNSYSIILYLTNDKY